MLHIIERTIFENFVDQENLNIVLFRISFYVAQSLIYKFIF